MSTVSEVGVNKIKCRVRNAIEGSESREKDGVINGIKSSREVFRIRAEVFCLLAERRRSFWILRRAVSVE